VERRDEVWKSAELTRKFLEGVRGGIPFEREQVEVLLRVVAARGEQVSRFADLGCGSGVLASAVLALHPRARATLVDFSAPMLEAARRELAGLDPEPRFVTADLAAPAWTGAVRRDAPFDLIVSSYAIHHLPDARKRELYGEIFDLLGAGGMFINVEHVASATAWLEAISDDLMIDSLHAFHVRQGRATSREQVAHDFVHRPDKAANVLAPVEVQCGWLRELGFADVDCYFKIFELAVFGGRRAPASPA
jgi:tRNA (cmo5U34)-methyltransferase